MIYGLTGKKRHGKSTAARYLVETHGFTEIALADPIRELLYIQNPLIPVSGTVSARLSDLVDEYGWEGVKALPTTRDEVRRLAQVTGTEWGRSLWGGDFWINLLEARLHRQHPGWWRYTAARIVIPDVRFYNEADWVKVCDGKVIQVDRPALVGDDDSHASEAGVPPALVDHFIVNADGDLTQMYAQLDAIVPKENNAARP